MRRDFFPSDVLVSGNLIVYTWQVRHLLNTLRRKLVMKSTRQLAPHISRLICIKWPIDTSAEAEMFRVQLDSGGAAIRTGRFKWPL